MRLSLNHSVVTHILVGNDPGRSRSQNSLPPHPGCTPASRKADIHRMTEPHARTPAQWTLTDTPTDAREAALRTGRGLAFVIGPMRGGTTLLRKILDAHPRLTSPAETWFMLPLLNMWTGRGAADAYPPKQTAAAIQSHLDQAGFVEACRAFAASFYAQITPPGSAVFIDKTPPYMDIADSLPLIFPEARFLLLCRDPRSTLWSRISWKHTEPEPIERTIEGVSRHVRMQAAFAGKWASRLHSVSYERLCTDPEAETAAICDYLGVDHDPAMIDYGKAQHHEGYGDENTKQHARPHADSLSKWDGKLPEAAQAALARACTPAALEALGYPKLAALLPAAA